MNSIKDVIRRELLEMQKPAKLKSTELSDLVPDSKECAAIPCIYLGNTEDIKCYSKPEAKECAAIPCIYLGNTEDIKCYSKPEAKECAAIPCIYLGTTEDFKNCKQN